MAKLAILLCAVLFASAVNGSFVLDALTSAKNKAEEIIVGVISATKQKFDDIKNKALELASKLEATASSYSDKLFEQIKLTLEKAQLEVNKLTGKDHGGVDVTECNKLASHLDYTALAVIANMSKCVVDKLETGSGYVQSIITLSENVLSNLTAIKDEARHCGDNVDGIKSAAGAIVCTNMAALKATWAATKTVPSLTIKMTKITYLLATLQPSLVYCSTTNGIATFYRESSTIVERTKECIREKINEARPDGLEVEYTTEKVLETTPEANTEEVSTTEKVDEVVEEVKA